jgi:hypothetical protein
VGVQRITCTRTEGGGGKEIEGWRGDRQSVTEVTLKATGLPLQSARYTVENPPELSGERYLIWSRGTSRAGATSGRRELAFAAAELQGSGVAGMGAAGTEGGGGEAAVWATLGLALREKRDREREVREGGGKEEGTSEDTIWLSNKEMQSVFFFALA